MFIRNLKKTIFPLLLLSPAHIFSAEILQLDRFLAEAVDKNPAIISLRHKLASDKHRVYVKQSWDFVLVGVERGETETMFSIEQMLPWPGKLSLKGKIAESERAMTEQELNAEILNVIYRGKKAFWTYWLNDGKRELLDENINTMKRFLSIAKTQYALGKVVMSDVLKANSELSRMESSLIELEQNHYSTVAELNSLINEKPDNPLGKPSGEFSKDIDYNLDELKKIAAQNLPEIKSKESLYEKNKHALHLAKLRWFPDIMAGMKFSETKNIYMLKMPIPLYFNRQISDVKSHHEQKESSISAIESAKTNAQRDIREFLTKYDSKKKAATIYETNILPLAKQALEITESAYKTGKSDFLDLLDSQERYLEYNMEYLKILSDKEISLAELERIVGVLPEEK